MFPVIDKRETGINLRRIMDKRGVTIKEVQKYLGLASEQSVYAWLNGRNMPSIDNLYALSELLKVSVDTLIRGNRVLWKTENRRKQRLSVYYKKIVQWCVV